MISLKESPPRIGEADIYDQHVDRFLDAATIKRLSQIRPWRGIVQVGVEWFGIGAAILLCEAYWHPLLYIGTLIWIGSRQGALAVLMHEASHYRLLKHRAWNDWMGEILTAWPLLVTMYAFRQNHWAHHRHVNKEEDPDWRRKHHSEEFEYPKSRFDMLVITLKYWVGFYALRQFAEGNKIGKIPTRLKYLRLAFYTALVTASVVFHFWVGLLMYWFVPLFTYFLWVIYVRGVAEHFGGIEEHDDLLQMTRHIETNFVERLFLAPHYVNVHIGHHLYPSVPFYNLNELQRLLMLNREYARRAHVTHGYLGFIRELQSSDTRKVAQRAGAQ